jgi:hypothetical protein
VTAERDSARHQAKQAMALADTLQRAIAGTSMGDVMREFTRATREAEFYRIRYHDVVPLEQRVSYTQSRSTRSHSRATSRGVSQPLPPGGPSGAGGAGSSAAGGAGVKPAASEDSTA